MRKRSKAYPLNHRLNRRPPETAGGFLYSHVIRRFAGLSGPNAPEKINTATVAYLANLTETAKVSPALARSIVQELADQRANLKLIASENYCSLSTQLTMGNLLTDKYAEGYPHSRFYAGCDNVDTIEDYACELPSPGEPDLLTVAKKVPHAVFCLLTALAFHRLTTQVPHAVEVALPRTARVPRLDHPPIKVFRFSSESLNVGIETHTLDGASIRVYCREKTLADAFKYRNKVGLDVALETLRAYRSQPKRDFQAVLKYARICRVENVIRPYLEATL